MEVGQRFNPQGIFTFVNVPDAVARMTTITSTAKLVYGKLVAHSGNGECFDAQETLAEELGMHINSIKKAIKELVDTKLVQVIKPQGKERLLHFRNCYLFLWCEGMEDSMRMKVHPSIPSKVHRGVSSEVHPSVPPRTRLEVLEEINTSPPANAEGTDTENALRKDEEGKDHPRWKRYATMLCEAIAKVKKIKCTSKVASWAKDFYALHKREGADPTRIKKALKWYTKNLPTYYGNKYFLVIECGKSFREKFTKLERAMRDPQWNPGIEEESQDGNFDESGNSTHHPRVRATVVGKLSLTMDQSMRLAEDDDGSYLEQLHKEQNG